MTGILMPVLKGAVVIGLFCFASYGIYYGLKKAGFTSAIQKSFRLKPNEKIYDDIKGLKFPIFAQKISKYDLRKQKQYIDAYLNPKKEKLKEVPLPKPKRKKQKGGKKNEDNKTNRKRHR